MCVCMRQKVRPASVNTNICAFITVLRFQTLLHRQFLKAIMHVRAHL